MGNGDITANINYCVFSLTEIVSGSVAGQISSDSSNVVELIEVTTRTQDYFPPARSAGGN